MDEDEKKKLRAAAKMPSWSRIMEEYRQGFGRPTGTAEAATSAFAMQYCQKPVDPPPAELPKSFTIPGFKRQVLYMESRTTTPCVMWLDPSDCDPPHGLELDVAGHDLNKVLVLEELFKRFGFNKSMPALVGYALNGRIQLLSGTHRHEAAKRAGINIPVTLWLGSDVEKSWGELQEWAKVMEDISVSELENWTREDLERAQKKNA